MKNIINIKSENSIRFRSNKVPTTISNFPTFAVVTFKAGGNPTLECSASPFISNQIQNNNNYQSTFASLFNPKFQQSNHAKKNKGDYLNWRAVRSGPAT